MSRLKNQIIALKEGETGKVGVSNLTPADPNKGHKKKKVRKFMKIIKKHGVEAHKPVIVTKEGTLVDGHNRFHATQKLGEKRIVARVLTPKEQAQILSEHFHTGNDNLDEKHQLKIIGQKWKGTKPK